MRGALEDPAAIGALALEHAARIMQAMGENVHVGVGPRHQLPVVPDDAIDLVERNSHGLSPVLTRRFNKPRLNLHTSRRGARKRAFKVISLRSGGIIPPPVTGPF